MAQKTNINKESKEIKKTSKAPYIIASILIVVAIVVVIAVINSNSSLTGNVVNEGGGKNCRQVQEPYDYVEEYQETVPYTDKECESKDLPYNIANFVLNSNTCNEKKKECQSGFMGIPYDCVEYCVDKTISCSLDLKNLDNEEQGSWTIKFNFYDTSSRNTITTKEVSQFLYPQTQKTFIGTARITSQGADGDANKEISCSYVEANIPTKQVCRDVTKYKDVTKTRTVVRYKNAEVCD